MWQIKKPWTLILIYYILCIYVYKHLLLPYLLNDSQTIRSTIHFSKPLLCVMLICFDWSHFHVILPVTPDKAVFVVLLCVQRYRGNRYFYFSKSSTKWQRLNLCFHSDQSEKTNKWVGNMLILHDDINMKRLGFILKTTRFNDLVDSFFWETISSVGESYF